jgi:hypothetical protein
MAEFKLGRIKFVWQGDWVTGTTYYKDDIVRYGGKTFLCVVGHIANADFYVDSENVPTRWNQVTDGQVWTGDWTVGTYYKENDIVKYGGSLYICNDGHTSAATTALGLEDNLSDWDLFATSTEYKTDWTVSTRYKEYDIVKYGGNSYICNNPHTSSSTLSSGLEANLADWTIYIESFDWKGDWTTSTRYKINDVVKYGGITYICNLGHTSQATAALGLEPDQSSWDYMHKGTEYKGTWSNASVRYKVNDIVKYGAGVWICTAYHSSAVATTFQADATAGRWAQYVEGLEFENTWTNGTIYQPGDIATYGGYAYVSKTNHTAATLSPPSTNSTDWDLYTTNLKFQGDWLIGTTYRTGDVIRLNGYTYVAIADSTGQVPPNLTYWERLNSGIRWQGDWQNSTQYRLGDAIRFGNSTYICVLAHISDDDDSSLTPTNNSPEKDLTGVYWALLSGGPEESVLTTPGDLVYFGGIGPTRLPIGETGQVLSVSETGYPEWKTYGVVNNLLYVAPHGVDTPAPINGLTIDKPWASLRYACDQIDQGYEHPNTKTLLENNRTFLQAEISAYVAYNIANNIGVWNGFVNPSPAKCERDMGLIVDALVYDLSHSGNSKTREATLSYFNSTTGVILPVIAAEDVQTVDAINYLKTIIDKIVSNEVPVANYQALYLVATPVKQYVDYSYVEEDGAQTIIDDLITIITDAITAGISDDVPTLVEPAWTINVKTGQYYETLPIILPARTGIVGDELRGTRISPSGKIIATNDQAKSLSVIAHIRSVTDEVIQNIAVTPTTGNTVSQDTTSQRAGSIGSTTALNSVIANSAEIKDIVVNNTPNAYVYPDPTNWGSTLINTAYAATGYPTGNTSGFDDARRLILANKAFLQDEVSEWILAQIAASTPGFVGFTYTGTRRTKCERDVGYIVDALVYDLTYGGNLATQIAARSYYSLGSFVEPTVELAPALAVQLRIKDIIDNIATGNTAGWTKTTLLSQDVSGTPGSADGGAFAQDRIQQIYDTINTGTEPTTIAPYTGWVATALVTARTAINTAKAQIQSDAVQFVKRHFPTLNFDTVLCSRDVGYMVDALGYDLMFGSNFLSIQSGLAYQRGTTSTLVVLTEQLDAQEAVIDFVGLTVSEIATSGAVVFADLLWSYISGIVTTGNIPVNTGSNLPSIDLDMLNGAQILRLNDDFLAAEASAYATDTFKATVTAATAGVTDAFTCSTTSWMVAGDAIVFTGTVFGGIIAGTTYYVQSIPAPGSFKISLTLGGTAADLTAGAGSMVVSYVYDAIQCQNDVKRYIQAIANDMTYTGNYHSVLASRYYRNALTGSKLEDMFYVRNGCGLRNMTLTGLDGTSDGNTAGAGDPDGLTVANAFGTKRPLAGAYVSLDPGWGPNDTTAWVTNKSTYVQNITTFGQSCVGQKIDGALHAGGNDSIVSNDFTQVLSDGIGAWVTNLGRAELVSVFTYYNHIGYLSENGGKIRATNGNNSYGDFGSVAEGVDVTEVPVEGVINNQGFEAQIANVFTSGDQIYTFEYENAGINYSTASYTISGAGINAAAVQDEFRDGGVYQVRLTDPGDSSGPGGQGYITNSNVAQSGTTTQITIANTDTVSSLGYVGMAIFITSGTGVGQYGYINTYNAATKVATIRKESDDTSGWDHVIPGTTIEAALDLTTFYSIAPRISFTTPTYTKTITSTISNSTTWTGAVYGAGDGSYTNVGVSGGAGNSASFNVTRHAGVYTIELSAVGNSYVVGNNITIAGSSLGGASPANDITVTITEVDSTIGNAIESYTFTGTAISQQFVAVASGGTQAASSTDGAAWASRTLPTNTTWESVAYGTLSGVGYYMAIASGGTDAAYSRDGITWFSTGPLPASATWKSVTYGNDRFVAVANGSTNAAYSTTGTTWLSMSSLPNASWTSVAYGKGLFVAVAQGGTVAASSANGTSWSSRTIPSGSYTSVAYGQGRFVAVATGGTVNAYSLSGTTWTAGGALPQSRTWNNVKYGNGIFLATSDSSTAATSENGLLWTEQSASWATLTVTAATTVTDEFTTTSTANLEVGDSIVFTGTVFGGVVSGTVYFIQDINVNGTQFKIESSRGGGVFNLTTASGSMTANSAKQWNVSVFGNPAGAHKFVVIPTNNTELLTAKFGAKTRARTFVDNNQITEVWITEPGGGYTVAPTATITDPNNVGADATSEIRIGNGVLGSPTFTNRGTGYSSSDATVVGDGYADSYQTGTFINVKELTAEPEPGANLQIAGIDDVYYRLVNVTQFIKKADGSYTARLQVSPSVEQLESPEHEADISLRRRYSQVRLTGHDFLDIGTGNQTQTNYPNLALQDKVPENETVDSDGGRVFFTSTDQDGNFRVGGLFNVEQATGVATLNADAFNIAGLNELQLGSVALGGAGASINEFSTDPFFTADSDSIVPTQRAIKAYIASQIGGGGSSINVNSLTAGVIYIAGNTITTTTGVQININTKMNFLGGVDGSPVALNYYLHG